MRSVFVAMALCAGATLTGCASIDQSLFGSSGPAMASAEPSTTPAPETPDTGEDTTPAPAQPGAPPAQGAAGPDVATPGEIAGTLPPTEGDGAAAPAPPSVPVAPSGAPAGPAVVSAAMAVPSGAPAASTIVIAPGADTGTSVNHTIVGLRANLQDVASRIAGAAQQLSALRRSNAQQLTTYYQVQAQISARLQIGTTRGNPELVAQWNGAQAALDQLTANLNAIGTLVAQINGEATRARGYLAQVQQTLDLPGAVDEDHRQLAVLEDEANQSIVVLDRLSRDASTDLRRQAAALTTERGRLAQLASGIKTGNLYAGGAAEGAAPSIAPAALVSANPGGAPIVTIHFARATTNYQESLYKALSQALQAQPSASFNVVAVSPPRRSASAVQTAQNDARRHAQDVMHTMTEMGVPATRLALSSATDPAAKSSEVQVFVR